MARAAFCGGALKDLPRSVRGVLTVMIYTKSETQWFVEVRDTVPFKRGLWRAPTPERSIGSGGRNGDLRGSSACRRPPLRKRPLGIITSNKSGELGIYFTAGLMPWTAVDAR